ncbi:MAG: hypothetical protein M3Z08_15210 [Chloroflexota bacterium]|nr:hypothetical protein [Chloroflexota bacterium]
MRVIGEIASQELIWMQPDALKSVYELRAGNEIAATLLWETKYSVLAEAAEGRWRFTREGIINQRNAIREVASNTDIALYKPSFTSSGGRLLVSGGDSFRWQNLRFWGSEKTWLDAAGTPLARFDSTSLKKIPVTIEPGAARLPHLPLLLAFGCYLLVLAYRDTTKLAVKGASPATL